MALNRTVLFEVISVILTATTVWAQGGPPMVTDDPGTPPDGHWEINIAALGVTTNSQTQIQAPYFDINYGWGDRIQLKAETGWVFLKQNSGPSQNGDETLLLGVKYRFMDEEKWGVAVSTYPQFQFHPSFASKTPGINEPGNLTILPLEFSKAFGDWELNPEVGYVYATQASDQLIYGVVLAYEKPKPLEPLFEIHSVTHLDHTGTAVLLNLGMRYTFNPHLNLIAALGHTVTHFQDSSTELDSYFGFQLEL